MNQSNIQRALNKLITDLNPYDQTDSKRYAAWKILVAKWINALQFGIKYEPLVICGDDFEKLSKFYVTLAYLIGCERKITIVSSSSQLLEHDTFKIFHKYAEEFYESQADLVVLIDIMEEGRTYEDIVERYKDRRTNILVIGNVETFELNKLNRTMTVAYTKTLPDEVDTSDIKAYTKQCMDAVNAMQTTFHKEYEKAFHEFRRQQPFIIHNSDRSRIREWFKLKYRFLKTNDYISHFQYDMPKMKRYDVSMKMFNTWMKDIKTLKNDISKYNILVIDYTKIDVSNLETMDSKLAHADPSGTCLLVYIVPDTVHGMMNPDWSEQHLLYTF